MRIEKQSRQLLHDKPPRKRIRILQPEVICADDSPLLITPSDSFIPADHLPCGQEESLFSNNETAVELLYLKVHNWFIRSLPLSNQLRALILDHSKALRWEMDSALLANAPANFPASGEDLIQLDIDLQQIMEVLLDLKPATALSGGTRALTLW